MREALREVVARRGLTGLALAVAAALALYALAGSFVYLAAILPLAEIVDGDLTFTARGTRVAYGEILANALTLALVTAALLGLWHLGRGRVRLCPDCRSEVDPQATVCAMCTSEIGRA